MNSWCLPCFTVLESCSRPQARRPASSARAASARGSRSGCPLQACACRQLGAGPAEESGAAFGRRAQPRASGQDAEGGREFASARDRRTASMWRRYRALRRRWRIFRAAPWSSAMIASSSTGSPRTSWRSRATAMSSGSRAISSRMRRTSCAAALDTPKAKFARFARG